jgi:hypothetical protein
MGSLPTKISASVPDASGAALALSQRLSVKLSFDDGSLATIFSACESAPRIGEEFLEAHSAGRSALLEDYKRLELISSHEHDMQRDRGPDKGHRAQPVAFRQSLARHRPHRPNSLDTMHVTLQALMHA